MGKILIGIIAILLLFGGFNSQIITGLNNLRIDSSTEAFVITTGGETSANVTLAHDLFQSDLGNITSISSNATETPIATTYTEATKTLLVTALNSATTRTMTVVYNGETEDDVWRAIGPFLTVIVIGGLTGMILWSMVKKGRR